jgi:hypothetical protein
MTAKKILSYFFYPTSKHETWEVELKNNLKHLTNYWLNNP